MGAFVKPKRFNHPQEFVRIAKYFKSRDTSSEDVIKTTRYKRNFPLGHIRVVKIPFLIVSGATDPLSNPGFDKTKSIIILNKNQI